MCAACQDPCLCAGIEIRFRSPEVCGSRELRHRFFILLALNIVDDQTETVAQINQRSGNAVAFFGSENKAGRIFTVAHRERLAFDADRALGDGRADFQHVRFQNTLFAVHQIVGIILEHRSTLCIFHSGSHHLHQADHGSNFPVTFRAEAIAFFHQTLDGKSRKLF